MTILAPIYHPNDKYAGSVRTLKGHDAGDLVSKNI